MKLTRRVEKLEETAKAMYEDEDYPQKLLRSLPTRWLSDLLRECDKLKERPEIESYLFVIDWSIPRDEPCKYQVLLKGLPDYDEFFSDPLKKIKEYPDHFRFLHISNIT